MVTNIIYCAFDQDTKVKYNTEAILSCYSLRKNCSNVFVKLFTNKPQYIEEISNKVEGSYFDKIEPIEYPQFHKAAKIRAILSSEGDTIFLDTHTIVLDNITYLFEVQRFDIAGVLGCWRENKGILTKSVALSESYIKLNTGVLFLRMESSRNYIRQWLDKYHDMYRLGEKNQDQPAFFNSVGANKDCSIMLLPNNYNFRLNQGGFISGHVYVIHTHYFKTLNQFIEKPSTDFAAKIYDHFASINNSTIGTVMQGTGYDMNIFRYTFSRSKQNHLIKKIISKIKSFIN
jgi:hypothetical protein